VGPQSLHTHPEDSAVSGTAAADGCGDPSPQHEDPLPGQPLGYIIYSFYVEPVPVVKSDFVFIVPKPPPFPLAWTLYFYESVSECNRRRP